MKLVLLILFNGFLFSISPSTVHDSKATNESPIVNDQKSETPARILNPEKLEKGALSEEDDKSKVHKPEPCPSISSIG